MSGTDDVISFGLFKIMAGGGSTLGESPRADELVDVSGRAGNSDDSLRFQRSMAPTDSPLGQHEMRDRLGWIQCENKSVEIDADQPPC